MGHALSTRTVSVLLSPLPNLGLALIPASKYALTGKTGCSHTTWMYRVLMHGLSPTGRAPSEQVRLG